VDDGEREIEFTRVDEALVRRACEVVALADQHGLSIVTAESCTGGLLAAVLSEAPGASEHLHGGFVTYTKAQKTAALGVPADLLARQGAVCREVAAALARGALDRSPADIAVAITGVAGPTPDEDGNPVGLMHFAAARRGGPTLHCERRLGDIGRGKARYAAVQEALALLADVITGKAPAQPAPDQMLSTRP
jgi:nicotinamide-nucleotide amidase